MEKRCKECFNARPVERMVQFGDDWVCHECKLSYIQKLKEGVGGDYGLNECPYCGEERSMSLREYMHSAPMGEYLCPYCDKFSKIDVPKWISRVKLITFLMTVVIFWGLLNLVFLAVNSSIGRTISCIVTGIVLVPLAFFVLLLFNKYVFQKYTTLITMDELMGRYSLLDGWSTSKERSTSGIDDDDAPNPQETTPENKKSL